MAVQKIKPGLWFDKNAEEDELLCARLFWVNRTGATSRIISVARYDEG